MLEIAKINIAKKISLNSPHRKKFSLPTIQIRAQKQCGKFTGRGGYGFLKLFPCVGSRLNVLQTGSEMTKTNRKGLVADLSLISKLPREVIST